MKKSIFRLLLFFLCTNSFAQEVIENPIFGYSNLPGKITKIEILEDATVLSFHIEYKPGNWIFIPKESFIKDIESDDKLFITKAEGIPFSERYTMPESGEVNYKLYFPKLNSDVVQIDFGEANDGGNWAVYDILINEDKLDIKIPTALLGNWFKTDGSNQWHYSFLYDKAIVDQTLWNYKTIKEKKNKYTITLEKEGRVKTISAKIDKAGQLKLGASNKKLQKYSTKRTKKPNYILKNDVPFKPSIFENSSTTYSGIIKGYTPRMGEATAMIYVNNVFTGNQESHLVKIADNGTFSVKFPVAYPQFVLFRGAGVNMKVFVHPDKRTFHFVSKDENLFMGDCAQINSDLIALKSIDYFNYKEVYKDILTITPEDFKKRIEDIKIKELTDLQAFSKKEFISQKALQLKKLDIEISALTNILSFELRKESEERRQTKDTKKGNAILNTKLNDSYYDVVTEQLLKNELAVMASQYSFFINRLMFANIFRNNKRISTVGFTTAQLADQLQERGVQFSPKELEMIEASKTVQTEAIQKRRKEFMSNYQESFIAFLNQHAKILNEIMTDRKKSLDLIVSLEAADIILNDSDKEMIRAYNANINRR